MALGEVIDKGLDVTRDVLVAPTTVGVAEPALHTFPIPEWAMHMIAAIVFVTIIAIVKEMRHNRHHDHHAHLKHGVRFWRRWKVQAHIGVVDTARRVPPRKLRTANVRV